MTLHYGCRGNSDEMDTAPSAHLRGLGQASLVNDNINDWNWFRDSATENLRIPEENLALGGKMRRKRRESTPNNH